MVKRRRATQPEPTPLQSEISAAVEQLSIGEVVSFGDVAALAGRPGAARAVGAVLSGAADTLPWWRVVYSDGYLPPCNPGLQAERLTEEGVTMRGFRVICSPKGRFSNSSTSD